MVALKLKAARTLARCLRMRQIHIVGCARSGTNMAHFAMLAFEGVRVAEQESHPEYPFVGALARMFRRGEIGRGPTVLVTKRDYRWTEAAHLAALVRRVTHEDLGLIHLVRDPRDVLLSTHPSTGSGRGYVSIERWADSAKASFILLEAASRSGSALVLRYEDFVSSPGRAQQQIGTHFGLRLRKGLADSANLSQLIATSGQSIAENRIRSMHRLRAIDPNSIGRWRDLPTHPDVFERFPEHRAPLESFMRAHGYEF